LKERKKDLKQISSSNVIFFQEQFSRDMYQRGIVYVVWFSTLQSYCEMLFRYRLKTKCVLRAASGREKCLVLKKIVDSKNVLLSVFYFNIVRNNGREIESFKKKSGGI
jgi:hypothetical protein